MANRPVSYRLNNQICTKISLASILGRVYNIFILFYDKVRIQTVVQPTTAYAISMLIITPPRIFVIN